tara:strand:+ start:358 stop:921 length:564 start_codon:yes stop_codon:yes gene_type:complete
MAMTEEEERILEMINSREGGKKLSAAQKAVLVRAAKLQGEGFERFNPDDKSAAMPRFAPDDPSVTMPSAPEPPQRRLPAPVGGDQPFRTDEQIRDRKIRREQERIRAMQNYQPKNMPTLPTQKPQGQPFMTDEQRRAAQISKQKSKMLKFKKMDPKPLEDQTIPDLEKSGGGSVDPSRRFRSDSSKK